MLLLYCNTVDWGIPPGRHSNTIDKETPHLKRLLKAKIRDQFLWQFFDDSFARGFDLNMSERTLNCPSLWITLVSSFELFKFSLQNLSVALAISQLNKILLSMFLSFSKCKICKSFRRCWENAHKSSGNSLKGIFLTRFPQRGLSATITWAVSKCHHHQWFYF